MKPNNNSSSPEESGDGTIIQEIKKDVKLPVWIIIGDRKAWPRKCNYCNRIKYYYTFPHFKRASRIDGRCSECIKENPRKGWHHTEDVKSHLSKKRLGENNPFYGKKHTPETLKLLSKLSSGENNPQYGKYGKNHPKYGISLGGVEHHSLQSKLKISNAHKLSGRFAGDKNPAKRQDVKRKIRLGVIKHIRDKIQKDLRPCYNLNACNFIDELNKKNNWSLQHALNGGEYYVKELGYWLDGYDKGKNIVFEYNERKHYNIDGTLKNRDINRMDEIKKLYGCKYLVYNEPENKMYEY